MKRSETPNKVFALLMIVSSFFIGFASHSIADVETGTFSGRVVDAEGNPVAKLPVMIRPAMVMGNVIQSTFFPMQYPTVRRALTDANGRFFITDITPGLSYFGALPYDVETLLPDELATNIAKANKEKDIAAFHASGIMKMEQEDFDPDVEILSLRIQGITFYPRTDHERIGFSVKPETHIENVEVTVQPRMRIQGRIVFKDGTPLASARVHLRFRSKTVDGSGNRQSGGRPRTDAEGYFVYYLDEKDDPAFYTFSVEYQDISAEAGPIRINPGERLDGLTLTFDSEPITLQPPSHIAPQPPSHIAPQALPQTKTLDHPSTAMPPAPRMSMPMSKEVWIVNPENLHAYKGIYCKTRGDAVAQARQENAHLVTINDAAEQTWLAKVFERKLYWIGLSRVPPVGTDSNATQWRWESGEPITYANWLPDYIFRESLDVSERNYAVMTFTDGKWYAVGPDSLVWRMTEMAILEKADVFDGSSTKEK